MHTAFFHALSQMGLAARLGVFLGGLPGGIVMRYVRAAVRADRLAIHALGRALGDDGKPLAAAFATMAMMPGRLATEIDPAAAGGPRGQNESAIAALAASGVRAMAIRLPPVVHGVGSDAGFPQRLLRIARKKGASAYVGDGANHSAHRASPGRRGAFRLARENGQAGARAANGSLARSARWLISPKLGMFRADVCVSQEARPSFLEKRSKKLLFPCGWGSFAVFWTHPAGTTAVRAYPSLKLLAVRCSALMNVIVPDPSGSASV